MMLMLIAIILFAYCFPTAAIIIFSMWAIIWLWSEVISAHSINGAGIDSHDDKVRVSEQFIKKAWKP